MSSESAEVIPTQQIHTFSGIVYELPCRSTRGAVINALSNHDPELFPLDRTDAYFIMDHWFAFVIPHDPVVEYLGNRHLTSSRFNTRLDMMAFRVNEACFEASHVDLTARHLELARYGLPYKLILVDRDTNDETSVCGVQHEFKQDSDGYGMSTYCCDGEHTYASYEEILAHCCHAVQPDGTCQQLTQDAIADILRLYAVHHPSEKIEPLE